MILDHITLLNQTVLECFNEPNEIKTVKVFTQVGLKVLGADFGFVWLDSSESKNLELVYKSPNLPFIPATPRIGGRNYAAIKSSAPDFVVETKRTPDAHYVSKHVKSFVIIPLAFKQKVYGTMVLCFKEPESFPKEKRILCAFIGNSVAQAITIHRLIETDIFLEEEKLKTKFIANATHEFRTPLAIIKGNVDLVLIKDKKNAKTALSALKAIDREVEHLSAMISDLVALTSKIKSG